MIAKPRTIESRTVMYVKASMGAKFANQEGWPLVINASGKIAAAAFTASRRTARINDSGPGHAGALP